MNKETTKPSREEAIAVIQEERDERVKVCNEAIQEVLNTHRCVLRAEPTIQNGVIVAVIHLLPAD